LQNINKLFIEFKILGADVVGTEADLGAGILLLYSLYI
jgi:hypothetical protein